MKYFDVPDEDDGADDKECNFPHCGCPHFMC